MRFYSDESCVLLAVSCIACMVCVSAVLSFVVRVVSDRMEVYERFGSQVIRPECMPRSAAMARTRFPNRNLPNLHRSGRSSILVCFVVSLSPPAALESSKRLYYKAVFGFVHGSWFTCPHVFVKTQGHPQRRPGVSKPEATLDRRCFVPPVLRCSFQLDEKFVLISGFPRALANPNIGAPAVEFPNQISDFYAMSVRNSDTPSEPASTQRRLSRFQSSVVRSKRFDVQLSPCRYKPL